MTSPAPTGGGPTSTEAPAQALLGTVETLVKPGPKPGIQTTEFWAIVLSMVNSFVLSKWHTDLHLTNDTAIVAAVGGNVVAGVYAVARTWLKAHHL